MIFGAAARDDRELTDLLARLRAAANWVFLSPKRRDLRKRFYIRRSSHLARAEPGSLAGVKAATDVTAPAHQAPQWLFAFDPAAMATFRTLALLATHPEQARLAGEEISAHAGVARQDLPYPRACVLESLRLWPTTPAVLRETTRETTWETGVLPAKTGILVFAPFFHRDDQRLPFANRFAPEVELEEQPPEHGPLIPFSGGPGVCPGRNLVLLLGSAMLAELLEGRQVRLASSTPPNPHRPLPVAELNNYALHFESHGGGVGNEPIDTRGGSGAWPARPPARTLICQNMIASLAMNGSSGDGCPVPYPVATLALTTAAHARSSGRTR